MKIFLSFLQSSKKHTIAAYDFWQYYLKNGIEETGHEWTEHPDVDWARGLVPQSKPELAAWRSDAWDKTLTYLKAQPADLFLSYLYPEQIDVNAINEIKKMGIPCVNFYCDNVRQFTTVPKQFKVFDLNWVPEHKALPMYKKAGCSFINLPMPMWITPQYRVGKTEKNNKLVFIGSKDVQRVLLFEQIVKRQSDIDLHIYGNGWKGNCSQQLQPAAQTSGKTIANQINFLKKHGLSAYARKLAQRNMGLNITEDLQSKICGSIDFNTYNNLTAESMVTLGVNRYPSFRFPLQKPDTYSRLRDIEAPMLGACYLTEFTPGLDQMYNIGNEIAAYHNVSEFIELAARLSADKQLRKTLRENGQKRALNDHSIPRSLEKIIDRLK
ncbi:glycosyltransferase family protein [Mucilaginibacter auburnensis]|uniref:Glycosyl transferase family 1 n=1 Tax=Mucilaginibacter auburnensis TaxID=1457233 RepID=A0A2H9VMA4_9SPHI|nr:glycosyltransferase [Mucilaginibacter auburnensis]PJJ79456.1 glycosyl transferase family 1 [Mucilaginibacter auburnensis]